MDVELTQELLDKEREERVAQMNQLIEEALGPEVKRPSEKFTVIPNTAILFMSEPYDPTAIDEQQKVLLNMQVKSFRIAALSSTKTKQLNLQKPLRAPEMYAGLIFPSIRSAEAIQLNFEDITVEETERLLKAWQAKINFSAFKTTAEYVKEQLGIETIGFDSGCMINLSKLVTDTKNPISYKPYLFPCSYFKNEDFVRRVRVSDLKVEMIPCYKTIAHEKLAESWDNVVDVIGGVPDMIVLNCPSAVMFVSEMLHFKNLQLCTLKVIALGPSTQFQLQQYRVRPELVILNPNIEEFEESIRKYLNPIMFID